VGRGGNAEVFLQPRYGKVVVYDRIGRELDDPKTARLFAVHSARELIERHRRRKPLKPSECSIDVCDETRNVLCTVPFVEASERP
jgi:hypothetical protein